MCSGFESYCGNRLDFFGLFFAGTACYTEQDWLKYEFYTPELLKGIPKISDKYDFNFGNITGPEAQIFTITFSMLLKFSLSEIT